MLCPTFLIVGSSRIGLQRRQHALAVEQLATRRARRPGRNSPSPCSQLKLMPTRFATASRRARRSRCRRRTASASSARRGTRRTAPRCRPARTCSPRRSRSPDPSAVGRASAGGSAPTSPNRPSSNGCCGAARGGCGVAAAAGVCASSGRAASSRLVKPSVSQVLPQRLVFSPTNLHASGSNSNSTSFFSVTSCRAIGSRSPILLEVLPHLRRQLVEMLQHRVGRPVFLDQLDGRLLADAGDAGDVVDRVAHQRLHLDRLGRRVAELLLQRWRRRSPRRSARRTSSCSR